MSPKRNFTPEQKAARNATQREWRRLYPHLSKKRGPNRPEVKARYLAKLRDRVINGLTDNNPQCHCCGEKELTFLTLHHVNGDGAEERKSKGKVRMYNDIIREGFPKDKYQILCFNCNCAVAILGYCPHSIKSG